MNCLLSNWETDPFWQTSSKNMSFLFERSLTATGTMSVHLRSWRQQLYPAACKQVRHAARQSRWHWTLQFEFNNQGKGCCASEIKDTANKNVRNAIKLRLIIFASARQKREFEIEDLDAQIPILIAYTIARLGGNLRIWKSRRRSQENLASQSRPAVRNRPDIRASTHKSVISVA